MSAIDRPNCDRDRLLINEGGRDFIKKGDRLLIEEGDADYLIKRARTHPRTHVSKNERDCQRFRCSK